MRKVFFLNIVFLLFLCNLNSSEAKKKVLVLTIPKSGTYLVNEVVERITKVRSWPLIKFSDLGNKSKKKILLYHIVPKAEVLKEYQKSFYMIIMIRDPRDTLLSQIAWMKKHDDWIWTTSKDTVRKCNSLSPDEQLKFVIDFPDDTTSMKSFCERAYSWMQVPGVFVCRFEDLVGPEGGGSREAQRNAIYELGEYLGYSLSPQDIDAITHNLYGNSITFRKGQIGDWKRHFNSQHIELFKKVMGQELINLGYEKDNDWQ